MYFNAILDEIPKPIAIKSEVKTEAFKVVPTSETAPASSVSIFATASATITGKTNIVWVTGYVIFITLTFVFQFQCLNHSLSSAQVEFLLQHRQ